MNHKDRLQASLKSILEINPMEIPTDEKLFSYQDIKPELERIQKSIQTALNYPSFIDELPDEDANQLANALEGLANHLSSVKQNRYDSVWLSQSYNSSLDEIKNRYRELYKLLVTPVREYANSVESNEARLQEILTEVDNLSKDYQKIKEESAKIKEESEANVQQAQEAKADISTVELSKYFEGLLGKKMPSYSWDDRRDNYKKWRARYEKK